MESEIVKLQNRVAELETVLAAISNTKPRLPFRRMANPALLFCSTIVIAMTITLTAGTRAKSNLQAPTRVSAPFQVWDKDKLLFSVQEEPSGGGAAVFVFTRDGLPAA